MAYLYAGDYTRCGRDLDLMEPVDVGEFVRNAMIVLAIIIIASKTGGELMAALANRPCSVNC